MTPDVWVLCQLGLRRDETKYFLADLPANASLRAVVQRAHQRWAIEQQHAEPKTELGPDDFVCRFYPRWNRHVALVALVHAFLQAERLRHGPARLSFPRARVVMTDILNAFHFVTHRQKVNDW